MIVIVLFLLAVLFMSGGHIFKAKRWKLFISVYEEPLESNLLNSLVFGHTANALLPFRFGDLIRVLWAGRKLKNGYSFALATVIADLYSDVVTVGMMFFGLSLIGKGGDSLLKTAHMYMWAFIILAVITTLCTLCRRMLKRFIRLVASVFNENIEFWLLYVFYLCIASLKDIIKTLPKKRFIAYTIGIWAGYVASYIVFAEAIQIYGFYFSTSDVFTVLFSGSGFYRLDSQCVSFWRAYILFPLIICWIVAIIGGYREKENRIARKALPQMNQTDRLAFLKTYYEGENREHIQIYLEINKDVTVVEDYSAGSNASTVLVMKSDGNMYYRKYAFNKDKDKLQEQIEWIERHQADLPLPRIAEKRSGSNFVTYDMYNCGDTTGLFRYIHTMPVENSWSVLKQALDDIAVGLHSKNIRAADESTINRYIEEKVLKNLRIILEDDRYIKALESYKTIFANGKELNTLRFYSQMLIPEHLKNIFSVDSYSDIHGDFTIENIVCLPTSKEIKNNGEMDKLISQSYYFIDPNTGNIHDSPLLDYGKLLQSLHGNYEFLMMVTSLKIEKNKVDFMITNSEAYAEIYERYKKYLWEHFTERQVLSIYYHEAVHWLRLMPYKICKNEKLAVVFYVGLLSVLDDIWVMEYGEE